MRVLRSPWLVGLVSALSFGCGGQSPPPDEPATPSVPAPEPEPPPPPAAEASPEAEPAETPPAETKPADDENQGRNIKYVVTPTGLEINVAGVQFVATASAIKVAGGWGVKVKAKASAKDGKPHRLLTPKHGALAFAGSVERGGQAQRFGDKRDGDEAKTIEEKQVELTRDWPGDSGEKPLKEGDKLTLDVGLWGLGEEDPESGRPVKQFFVVKMTAGKGKPDALVQPPDKFQ
jgi:hypothetical protein